MPPRLEIGWKQKFKLPVFIIYQTNNGIAFVVALPSVDVLAKD